MLKKADAAEIINLIDAGWSLVGPNFNETRWYLQHGKPGHGGETKRVHPAIAKHTAKHMNKISPWRAEYMGWKGKTRPV